MKKHSSSGHLLPSARSRRAQRRLDLTRFRQPPYRPIGIVTAVTGVGLTTGVISNLVLMPDSQVPAGINPSAISQFFAFEPPEFGSNGRPNLFPLPKQAEVWECEVVVVGGSLGGVAAASHAMQAGARTCLIELTPWLGGQVSAQGVSAIDESRHLLLRQEMSETWRNFKQLIREQWVKLPDQKSLPSPQQVRDINSCWVGRLCFPPEAGAQASEQLLQTSSLKAPGSRWGTNIAFKGAEFDPTGKQITAVYGVQRTPRQTNYLPTGHLSQELTSWYSWSNDPVFTKKAIKLQAPAGKRLLVIDATDTGELIGWAGIPYRLGIDSRFITQELSAPEVADSRCTQAFTYPFTLAIHNDQSASLKTLAQVKTGISKQEHRRNYSLENFPMFDGKSFFNYRRIVSTTLDNPFRGTSDPGDITLVNWNQGNDWGLITLPLILNDAELSRSKQKQNWTGGLSLAALRHGEAHALLFGEWLIQTQARSEFPLTFLSGPDSPMATQSGLSMVPYFREGRRIVGRPAYGQPEFMLLESDLHRDMAGGRNFNKSAVAIVHYAIDIHGCRDLNWQQSLDSTRAATLEDNVRPTQIPLESLIPQGVDNLLIGGKSLAVSHIANAVTRVHQSEWNIGAAAGATAGWLLKKAPQPLTPDEIVVKQQIGPLQAFLVSQGLRPQ